MLVLPVEAQLVLDIKDQEEAKGDAYHQSQDVEEAIPFISFEVTDGDEQEAFKHIGGFRVLLYPKLNNSLTMPPPKSYFVAIIFITQSISFCVRDCI